MSDYGDGIGGFVLESEDKYWSLIHEANSMHLTVNQRYTMLLRQLESDGVQFKDIRNRLLNQAKKIGLYTPTVGPWCEVDGTGSYIPTFRPYKDLVKARVAWAVALSNFLSWVGRNWSSYSEEKTRTESAPKPKTRQTLVVGGQEYKVVIRGIDDQTFEDWKAEMMSQPVEDELTTEQIERIMAQNMELLETVLLNLIDEDTDGKIVERVQEALDFREEAAA